MAKNPKRRKRRARRAKGIRIMMMRKQMKILLVQQETTLNNKKIKRTRQIFFSYQPWTEDLPLQARKPIFL